MSGHYIEVNGVPELCGDLMRWAREFDRANRAVAFTKVGESEVSTVFLGLDHRFGDGPPLLYETMIFGGAHDDYQTRYSTRPEAQAGHAAVCAWLRGEGPEPA